MLVPDVAEEESTAELELKLELVLAATPVPTTVEIGVPSVWVVPSSMIAPPVKLAAVVGMDKV